MSQKKELFSVRFHQDDEDGINYIGEIDGYNDEAINEYLKIFGQKGVNNLVNHFAFLIYKVKEKQNYICKKEMYEFGENNDNSKNKSN